MSRASRNPKELAQRIERHYFKKRFAIPRWRIRLTLIAALASLAWLGWRSLAHDRTAFSSGPVSPRHGAFEKSCGSCHVLHTAIGSTVTNGACLKCHDGPVHQEQQISTPDCVSCHIEHHGASLLLSAEDKTCTGCHRSLQTKNGRSEIASHIESIVKGHPEFRPLRSGATDSGTIKFNHKIHLRKDLKAPRGSVQLQCNDCHRPTGIVQQWPYGQPDSAEINTAAGEPLPRARTSTRAHMQPLNYDKHCSSCHPLIFDKQINELAPHKKPEVVIPFIEQQLRTYIGAHPEELRPAPRSWLITRASYERPPQTATEWLRQRLQDEERLLWTKTCAECHSLDGVGLTPLPEVRKANFTEKWLGRGLFDHAAHNMWDCVGCHTQVQESERTSDVLIPGIKVCQSCHNSDSTHPSASPKCFECHTYHDWTKEQPRHGNLGPPPR